MRLILRIGLASAVLLVALSMLPLQPSQPAKAFRICIDNQGTARIGPVPLRNKKFRNLVLSMVHRVYPNGGVDLVESYGAPSNNVVAVLTSLASAGIEQSSVMK